MPEKPRPAGLDPQLTGVVPDVEPVAASSIKEGTPSARDRLSFAKTACPSVQLTHAQSNTAANREVIEFTCVIFSFLSPSFWPTNCLRHCRAPYEAVEGL